MFGDRLAARQSTQRSLRPAWVLVGILAMGLASVPLASSAATIHVPSEVGTISEAVAQAVTGDTVLVAPGTYEGEDNRNLDFEGKDIVLMSSGGWSTTIIDMGEWDPCGRFVTCESGESSAAAIRGFTVRHGFTEYGGGIRCAGGSSPLIEDCSFYKNSSAVTDPWGIYWSPGGAIYIEDSSPTVRNCEFRGNRGRRGGAIAVSGSSSLIEDCYFYQNCAEAVHMSMTSTEVGGGLWITGGSSATVTDCEFINNASAGPAYGIDYTTGGAVFADDGASATFVRCSFHSNIAGLAESICSIGSALTLVDCLFRENRGAVHTRALDFSASGCTFACPDGVALNFVSGEVEDCLFHDVPDTVIKVGGSDCAIRTSTIVGNSGPVFCVGGTVEIEQTILAFGGAEPIVNAGADLDVHHCLIFGHAQGDSLPVEHSDNLFVDPLFCDRESDNFWLCSDSPCLPAGNSWGVQIGAFLAGCGPCNTAVTPMSWGKLKALYR